MIEFVKGNGDLANVLKNKDELNKLLNDVVNQTIENFYKKIVPTIVGVISKEVRNFTLINAFFTKNEDLLQHKELVAKTYQELVATHPDKNGLDIVNVMLEDAVRAKLGLAKGAQKKKPAFAGRRI